MLKMLTAYTDELDFPDDALHDILEQLDIEHTLLKNTVGIVHCRYEFIKSGFVGLLCTKLPFDVIGSTSIACATMGEYGSDLLALSVFTGDDVEFSIAVSGPVSADSVIAAMGGAYLEAAAGLSAEPALAIVYTPMNLQIGTSKMLDGIAFVSGDVPVFGAVACDETPDYHENRLIYKGEAFRDSAVLLLMGGDVHPRFLLENTGRLDNMQEQQGIITESDGCLIMRVNDMPFLEYIADIGLSPDTIKNIKAFPVPFKVNYNDGTRSLIRMLSSVTDEGYAVFTGDMPVGSAFTLQSFSYGSVAETAESMAKSLASMTGVSGAILYSCIGRSLLLGMNLSEEMRAISEAVSDRMPYHICYGGGEFCPLEDDNGELVQHSHSFSLAACVF
jgi:hypothetical protein